MLSEDDDEEFARDCGRLSLEVIEETDEALFSRAWRERGGADGVASHVITSGGAEGVASVVMMIWRVDGERVMRRGEGRGDSSSS
jgi:hypothetical protein